MTRTQLGLPILLVLLLGLSSPASAQCPVDETFDVYPPGTDLQGTGGWKGFNNDPFFTAFVSTGVEPANSPPQSVIIESNANIVRETSCLGESLVSLSVFQWIASPYVAGVPVEPQAGSIFRLFNTYVDSGPQLVSGEARFDPGDGQAKFLHAAMGRERNGGNRLESGEWISVACECSTVFLNGS